MSNVESANFGGDRSRLYAVYNSRGEEHILVARSEHHARHLARKSFDLVRTHRFVSKELPKDYLMQKHLIPFGGRLQEFLENGAQGKIRVEYSNETYKASAYFFAYGWSQEVKL